LRKACLFGSLAQVVAGIFELFFSRLVPIGLSDDLIKTFGGHKGVDFGSYRDGGFAAFMA